MKVYVGDMEDSIRLLAWFNEMMVDGTLQDTFFPSVFAPAPFINLFQSGACRLIYGIDDKGLINKAAWGQLVGATGVVFFSIWLRPSQRRKDALAFSIKAYQITFNIADMILGVTKQEGLLSTHKHFGYKIIAKLPRIWEGEPGYLLSLTKEDFYSNTNIPVMKGE